MNVRPFRNINRKKTKVINVGRIKVGGNNPISVQSMTNTLTTDVKSTIKQIQEIQSEGADLVRVSCPDEQSSKALKEIIKHVDIPIVADIHFHYKRAIEAAENGASCLRINPGNIGSKSNIKEIIRSAKNNNCSIRVGVNAGSLEKDILEKYKEPCPEALVESALRNVNILEQEDFFDLKISVKSSDVFLSIEAYRQLSKATDYPLHLGITEAGGFLPGDIIHTEYIQHKYKANIRVFSDSQQNDIGPLAYFQLFGITQKVNSEGWTSELTSKMRINKLPVGIYRYNVLMYTCRRLQSKFMFCRY